MIRHNFNPHSRSAPEPENFDSELNGPIKQKEDKPNKKASLLEIANNSISSGLGQFNQSLASTLDFLLPTEFLGKYDFVSKINDYYSNQADRLSNKLQESVSDRGKPIQIGAKALEATTSAAPNALLAVMSGGTSAAAQGSELDTLEKYSAAKYNNSTEYAMLERYATDVETGWISPLSGFENYQTLNRKIETEIVGATTANGLAINGFVPHFMQRVIGTTVDPKILEENLQIVRRSGVDVDEIKNAVFSPEKIGDITVRKTGHKSIKLIGRNCVVTINPDTGELIQTNPLGG